MPTTAAFKGDIRMNFDKAQNRSKDATMSERLYIPPVIDTKQTVKDSKFHPDFRQMDPLSFNSVIQATNSTHVPVGEDDNNNEPLHEYDEYVYGCGCDCCCGCGHDL